MKMCLDGVAISKLQGTGLYTYSYEMMNKLFKNYPQPQYHLIWEGGSRFPLWKKNNLIYTDFVLDRKGNDFSTLKNYLINNKIDLFHSPNNGLSIPDKKVCKYIITVHDLAPLTYKNFVDKKYFDKHTRVFPNAVRESDVIIAVSEFIKKELIKIFKVSEKKIRVIYPGCSSIFKPLPAKECEDIIKNKYGIQKDFIFHAGSIHPRKNLDKLIEVFSHIKKINNDLKLVIGGKIDGKRKNHYLFLKNLAKKLKIQKSVLFTGIIDYTDMPAFYNKTVCAVNLSGYEGFPTVTAEAIACNAPVICSNHPVFMEAAGNEAIFVEPNDIEFIRKILLEIIYNESYKKLISDRYKIAGTIKTWENSIKKIINLYESTVYSV